MTSKLRPGMNARGNALQAVILDVDGTLADTEEAHRQAFNEAFRIHSLDWVWSAERYADLLLVPGGKERIRYYIDGLGIASPTRARLVELVELIHRTKTDVFTEFVRLGRIQLRPGVHRLIGEVRAAGARVAIASTTSAANVDALIAASFGSDAQQWFSAIATGDVVARKKPAPDIYCLALDRLGLTPRQALAIEDSQIGVQAATAAGLVTIATPTRWTAAQNFTAADLVLPTLGDPDDPLAAHDERRIGAKYLGMQQLAALHATALKPTQQRALRATS